MDFQMTLECTAYTDEQIMTTGPNQIALAGRSNVGKSSLINALCGDKKIAKVSATPGKTRSVNYYRVMPYNFFLVDLPGYGYARASHSERRQWATLLEQYFMQCKVLTGVGILLDCRLPPQQSDQDMISYARQLGLPILPILTKADKATQKDLAQKVKMWTDLLQVPPTITSSNKKRGIRALCQQLITMASPAP